MAWFDLISRIFASGGGKVDAVASALQSSYPGDYLQWSTGASLDVNRVKKDIFLNAMPRP